jgi:hypothetical protein
MFPARWVANAAPTVLLFGVLIAASRTWKQLTLLQLSSSSAAVSFSGLYRPLTCISSLVTRGVMSIGASTISYYTDLVYRHFACLPGTNSLRRCWLSIQL